MNKYVRAWVLLVFWSPAVWGDEVGHRCVYNCDEGSPPPTQQGKSPAAPAQNNGMQNAINQGMMNGLQQGLQQFQQDQARKKQLEEQRARDEEARTREGLQKEQESEQKKQDQGHQELMGEMLAVPAAAPTRTPTASTQSLKKPAVKVDYANAARRQHQALMCGLKRVFELADKLPPEQKATMKSFKEDVTSLKKELARKPAGQTTLRPTVDMQFGGKQFIVHALALRNDENGEVGIQVQYHYSGDGKTEEGQTVVRTDSYGRIIGKEAAPATERCLEKIE